MKKGKYQQLEAFMGRLLISIIVFIGTFVIIELVSRKFLSARPPIEQHFPVQRFRHPRPYSMFAGKPSAQDLNSLGYRGASPGMPKQSDEYRVFFLGGSTVYVGKPPISYLVQELFHNHGMTNVKVYNFGVVSSVSGMELTRIVYELSDLDPDLIVMYNGGNDILHPWKFDPRPGYPFNFIVYENNPLLDKDIADYPAISLFLYGSNIMRYFFRNHFTSTFIPLYQTREESGYKSLQWKEEIATHYVNNLVKASKISKAFGTEFIAFFQPLVYFKKKLSDQEQRFRDGEEGEFAEEMRQLILSKIELTQDNYGVNIVDLSGIYAERPDQIFTDSIHTTQGAKPIVAQTIFNKISEMHR